MTAQERTKDDLRKLAESAGLRLTEEEFEAWSPFLKAILAETDRLSDFVLDDTGPVTIFDPRKQ
jgi:Asp-tRNA(Asn)/Glu-tRNA(Gln) amidotransferase C subunit